MPRGKFSKPTRGGGKKFSRDVRPADDAPGMWYDGPREKEEEDDVDSEEEDSSEEGSDEDESGAGSSAKPKAPVITADMSRDERRAAQKALKEAKRAQLSKGVATFPESESEDEEEEEEAAGPSKQKPPKATVPGLQTSNPNAGNVDPTISRRDREAAEAAAAKERYRKLHEAGKTEEAKSDLARLAIIRKEREEKAKQRQAEIDEKKRQADIKALQSKKKLK
ncbi:28 kDa heat- and acid-stable phosphoprotein [Drechslerella dactyloides]|uniref:28 kDa heat- and acid-stable phosphoprotein n=1 Tax=Drechslerella dactyloides TaxID=74499 RepID=A0AAD6NIW1_DREDA|nr:28 kDa heat- and acid-stable phosphoprotein [Drechslerella dactyloides]